MKIGYGRGFIFCTLFCLLVQLVIAQEFAGGSGTANDPYLVAASEHLNNVRNYLDAHFLQVADIDLSDYSGGKGFEPIGEDLWNIPETAFTGSYDGQGNLITNLTINRPFEDNVGLWGNIGEGGSVQNLRVEGAVLTGGRTHTGLVAINSGTVSGIEVTINVRGQWEVGGLVGKNLGEILDCHFHGSVSGTGAVGGLAGNNCSRISNCSANGSVSGILRFIGGLAGCNSGTIMNSSAIGTISGDSSIGGLVGWNEHYKGRINACYAAGEVSGDMDAGGLAGTNEGSISNTYATGAVTGNEKTGGLVGNNWGEIKHSFAVGRIIGKDEDSTGGLVGLSVGKVESSYYDYKTTAHSDHGKGVPLSTGEMYQQNSFMEWDFNETWSIIEGKNYPYLQWVLSEKEYEAVIDSYMVPQLYAAYYGRIYLTLRNTGTQPWVKGTQVYLGASGDQDDLAPSRYWRVGLRHDVEPAQLHTFIIPVYPKETGIFTTEWQMLKESEFWFGEKFSREVVVFEPPTIVERRRWQFFE